MQKNKIIFFGTQEIAVKCLETLISHNQQILFVVSKQDLPSGRKKQIIDNPVKKFALRNNIKCYQPAKTKEIVDLINDSKPDMIISCAYGNIICDEILKIGKHKPINIHPSLLPKYRGGSPIHSAVLNGEVKTGVSLMYIVSKLDAGDVVMQEEMSISNEDTYQSLYIKLTSLSCVMLIKYLDLLEKNKITPIKQDEKKASFCYNITSEDEIIDWKLSAKKINNKIRGLFNVPCARTTYNGLNIKILGSKITNTLSHFVPGTIEKIDKTGIYVCTSDYLLQITDLQLPSKNPVSVKNMLNGKHIFEVGKLFI